MLTATANDSGWTMTLTGRDPVAVRVIAMGGDSVVTEAGPYQMWGTFAAEYSSEDKASGKVTATRRK